MGISFNQSLKIIPGDLVYERAGIDSCETNKGGESGNKAYFMGKNPTRGNLILLGVGTN